MDAVYKAHRRFGNLLHDEKFQINFRLEPGDIFSFNNSVFNNLYEWTSQRSRF